jgi:hypothetical protein
MSLVLKILDARRLAKRISIISALNFTVFLFFLLIFPTDAVATSRKVAGSSPDEVTGLFSIDLVLPQPLTEMSARE